MRDGRALVGPNDIRVMLSPEDITMFNNTIDSIEELFRELRKANPRWEAETKAQESRQGNFNTGNGNGNSIPAGPKRAREDDDERERERLDCELDRDRNDRRDSWAPRQQPFDRIRQFDRQRNFANQGFGSRLDNPKRRR
jgi:hypothetical protein